MTGTGRRELALIGAGTIVAGSFLPWFTVTTIFGTISRSGVDTVDGKATAVLGAVAVATGYSAQVIASRVIGLVVAALGIFNLVDVERLADDPAASVSSGVGLWIVIGGGVVVAAQPDLRRDTGSGVPVTPQPPPPPLPPPTA